MKRTLFLLSFITLTASITQAQYNKTSTGIYAEAGANLATFYQSAGTNTALKFKNILEPEISLYLRTKYPTLIGFDAGVCFSAQGAKFSDSLAARRVFDDSLPSRAVLYNAYAFGDALYYFELENNNTIDAGVGLYTGFVISAQRVTGSDKTTIDFGNGDKWKSLDYGLQLKTAFNLKDFLSIGAQYRISFRPTLITTDASFNLNNARNSVFTISAAIRLVKL